MKALLLTAALASISLPVFGQTPPPPEPNQQAPAAQQEKTSPPKDEAQRSVLEVKPGSEAIKNKDLWERTGYFHPFVRMPKYVLQDQKNIWTAPFHTAKSDIKWWVIFGSATGVLIATDKWTAKELPNTNGQVRLGTTTSRIGAAYSLVPISAGFYFLGTKAGNERFRETGLLGFETLIDTTIVESVIKMATHRARPLEGDGKGHFWDSSGSFLNASFPSGHAINSFALASVFAHQYPHPIYLPMIAYGLASTVVGARLAARKHFPGDVVAGAALGWFIGDYVYGKRHNRELDPKKASLSQKVLAHVHFGFGFE
jgi:membrane-associated phospholipid phosphatase